MFKPGQKVNHKTQNLNGVVVARAPRFGKTWCAVLWTLPNGRREQRVEHYTNLKQFLTSEPSSDIVIMWLREPLKRKEKL